MPLFTAFDLLTEEAVQAALSTAVLGRKLQVLEEVPSTNTTAVTLAQQGASDGMTVVAERQSAGRGRLGRSWHSPPRKNLYCSVILRKLPSPDRLAWLPLIAATAAVRAVQVVSRLQPSLKWPNDLMIGTRKLGGLLCESGGTGTAMFVVVGIGLNVNVRAEEFPEDLRETATSLWAEGQRPFDRAVLLAALLSELEIRRDSLLADRSEHLLDEYRIRCATLGRQVRVQLADGEVLEGRAESVTQDGSLRLVRGPSRGDALDITAGDVVHLR